MEAHVEELGPVDIVVIAFPAGSPMSGEAVPILLDLVERGIIRVLRSSGLVWRSSVGTLSGQSAWLTRRCDSHAILASAIVCSTTLRRPSCAWAS
jgi:hypothetical protein